MTDVSTFAAELRAAAAQLPGFLPRQLAQLLADAGGHIEALASRCARLERELQTQRQMLDALQVHQAQLRSEVEGLAGRQMSVVPSNPPSKGA
jgi:uncharacterized protein HemX